MTIFAVPRKQHGATLLISLILLLVLTILALAAGRSATLQQRMAGNLQQQNLAFQTAENGIQAAILQLQDESTRPQRGAPKYLFSTDGTGLLSWTNNCNTGTNNHYFCAEVEQVDCGAVTGAGDGGSGASSIGVGNGVNLTGGTCFRITSTGHFETSTAIHQQGYIF